MDVINNLKQCFLDYSKCRGFHESDAESYGIVEVLQTIVDGFEKINTLFLTVREQLVRKDDADERLRKAPLIMRSLYALNLNIDGMLNSLDSFFRLNKMAIVDYMGREEEYLKNLCKKHDCLKLASCRFLGWWKEMRLVLQEALLPQIEGVPSDGASLEIEEVQDNLEGR